MLDFLLIISRSDEDTGYRVTLQHRQKGQAIQKMVEDLFRIRRVPSVITLTGRYLTDSALRARDSLSLQ